MTTFSRCLASNVGLAREMPMCDPPRKWMRLTASMVRGVTCSTSPCISHSKPSRMPTTSTPPRRARIVAAPMTLLIPGAGPPPTRMANLFMGAEKSGVQGVHGVQRVQRFGIQGVHGFRGSGVHGVQACIGSAVQRFRSDNAVKKLGVNPLNPLNPEPLNPLNPVNPDPLQRLSVRQSEALTVLAAQQLLALERLIARRDGVGDFHLRAVVVNLLAGAECDDAEEHHLGERCRVVERRRDLGLALDRFDPVHLVLFV